MIDQATIDRILDAAQIVDVASNLSGKRTEKQKNRRISVYFIFYLGATDTVGDFFIFKKRKE